MLRNLKLVFYIVVILFAKYNKRAEAWSDHGRLFDKILLSLEQNKKWSRVLNSSVEYETLESFLTDTQNSLPKLLDDLEAQSIANEPSYRPTPKNLRYTPNLCNHNLELCFKQAIRVNPKVPFENYVQDFRNEFQNSQKATINDLAISENIFLKDDIYRILFQAKKLGKTENLLARHVLSTFSDEPDNGLDINLYEDNIDNLPYGFGTQPLGVANIPYSSQFLFHVGTYNEDCFIKFLSPRIKESYPAYRSRLYLGLAKFAKQTGHPYWALRFIAWGLHYIEDSTQPYHSSLFPDYTIPQMFLWFTENSIGFPQNYEKTKSIIANRHTILENMLAHLILYSDPAIVPIVSSLQGHYSEDKSFSCNDISLLLRKKISSETIQQSKYFINTFIENMPENIFSNQNFDVSKFSNYQELFNSLPVTRKNNIVQAYSDRMKSFSLYSQKCLEEIFPF